MGQEHREIECAKTEPDQLNHRGQDGEKTMQIKGDVRRGGRGGMTMPLVAVGASPMPSVWTRHTVVATAMRHATRAMSIFQAFETDATLMEASLPVSH